MSMQRSSDTVNRAVYMDYNATAPVRPEATTAVLHALQCIGNPSSVHRFGRLARRLVEEAREAVATLVQVSPSQVIFTSGGTEANNAAIRGAKRPRHLVSAGEHDSVLMALSNSIRVPLRRDGVVDLDALLVLLGQDGREALVSVMLANNETGVIQPVSEVAALAHDRGALVHCDAVQAAGKIAVDMPALGVDLMSLSAHKLGGPQGAGALVVADGVELAPLLKGGGQERGYRAGTESVPAIAGFGAAARAALAELEQSGRLADERDRLEERLRTLAPEIEVYGLAAARLPNTSCFAMRGLPAETQVMALDLDGIAVSAGSACSSGKVRPSHVLAAMGAEEEAAGSAIRVSLGWRSDPQDIDRFVDAWARLYARYRSERKAPAIPAA